MASSGGMGLVPITSVELQAWARGTNTPLLPLEFQAVLDASRGFVAGYNTDEKPEELRLTGSTGGIKIKDIIGK